MSEIIEKLKDKGRAQALGLLTEEEQEIIKVAGKANCLTYAGQWEPTAWPNFRKGNTYVLKPDYQPKEEHDKFEAFVLGGMLGIDRPTFKLLYTLPGLPDFHGFFYDDEEGTSQGLAIALVATCIRKGHKVYALFAQKKP